MTPFVTVRHPLLSLLQSAAAAVARRRLGNGGAAAAHPLVLAVSGLAAARAAGDAAPAPQDCAGLGLQLLEALLAGDAARRRVVENRLSFSQCDPLWAETLVDYVADFAPDGRPRPIPYIRYAALTDFVITAPAAAMRIALISDWGTGTDEARAVAALVAAQAPDAVIHLGDIYFAGTPDECQAHFLGIWRAVLPDTKLFTLCGNHDTYSGGRGYYGLLREIGQPASYFSLRSPDRAWQILAADTGLHDRDPFDETAALTFLDPAEELWHADKLRGFPGQTIFLSHHQPFSAFRQIGPLAAHDPTNPNLIASHERLSAAGRIDAWFWGHEHSLRIYAPYRGIANGRNIGFGAVPEESLPPVTLPGLVDPPALAEAVTLDAVDGAYTHGFAILDLSDSAIDVSYWQLTRPDAPLHAERLSGLTV